MVQLYVGDVKASVDRPAKELKGFEKLNLQPKETKTATFYLTKRDLSFWSEKKNDWVAKPGQFKLMVGASVADIRATELFDYN